MDMICKMCDKPYRTQVLLGQPKAKHCCSRQCLKMFMRTGLLEDVKKEAKAQRNSNDPDFWQEKNGELNMFKRFVEAFDGMVDRDDMKERFGKFYNCFVARLTSEQRQSRLRNESLGSTARRGVAPTLQNYNHRMFGRKKKKFNIYYEPMFDGLIGESP